MDATPLTWSYRGRAGIAAAVLALPALAACSSSSSGGQSAAKARESASAAASAAASRLGVTPIPDLAPGGHGPNGDITAPVTNAPSKTSPGGSEVFPNVSSAQSKRFAKHLSKLAAVRTVTYYPQFDQLQVYFTDTASAADRKRVHDYVIKHDPDAAGSPNDASTTPATSASPTASAS